MRIKLLLLTVFALSATACSTAESGKVASKTQANATQKNGAAHSQQAAGGHGHAAPSEAARVPAFEADPKRLPPTLAPERFGGKVREAYQVVREIPRTIAQLPCYCHCDRGFGHKSLHSCFVDDHASMCAVCVNEALAAYRLEKEERLTPGQIRERIIAEYSRTQ